MELKYLTGIVLAFMLLTSSCKKEYIGELHFNGDSIVAMWNVEKSFPSYMTYNHAKSGSQIEYLTSFAHKFGSKTLVVEIGTNDLFTLSVGNMDRYVDLYIKTIVNTDASQIYLYSLLPRYDVEVYEEINERIVMLNSRIKQKSKEYPQIQYIDAYHYFEGKLSFYRPDRLHLNRSGYMIMQILLSRELE